MFVYLKLSLIIIHYALKYICFSSLFTNHCSLVTNFTVQKYTFSLTKKLYLCRFFIE